MKQQGKLLNAPLSSLVAQMGHTDGITVCDAGLPIPAGPEHRSGADGRHSQP